MTQNTITRPFFCFTSLFYLICFVSLLLNQSFNFQNGYRIRKRGKNEKSGFPTFCNLFFLEILDFFWKIRQNSSKTLIFKQIRKFHRIMNFKKFGHHGQCIFAPLFKSLTIWKSKVRLRNNDPKHISYNVKWNRKIVLL